MNRSLTRPSGAAHQAGHGSDRSSRQLTNTRKPKSGYQPLVETIGSADRNEAITTVVAGTNAANGRGPLPMRWRGGADHQGVSAWSEGWSAATAAGWNGGSTMAKLTLAGSASGMATAPSSSSLTMRAIGTSGG